MRPTTSTSAPDTRFWKASGIDVVAGRRRRGRAHPVAGGAARRRHRVRDAGFAATSGAGRGEPVFTLYADQATAMKQPETIVGSAMCSTSTSPCAGCPSARRSLCSGCRPARSPRSASSIDPATRNLRGRVEIVAYPERLVARLHRKGCGRRQNHRAERAGAPRAYTAAGRGAGLRAQLRSGNLLTGQLYVAFDFFPDAAKPKVDWNKECRSCRWCRARCGPRGEDHGILAKLDKLPFEAIGADLKKVLETTGPDAQGCRQGDQSPRHRSHART